jgi:hypothetical protein
MNHGATKNVLARLEECFGPAARRDGEPSEGRASLLEALRLQGRELVSNACQSLAQWLHSLVDSPGERLASADRAADWFAHYVEEQVRAVISRKQSVRTQRDQLKSRFVEDPGGATRKLGAFFGRGRRRDTKETTFNPLKK